MRLLLTALLVAAFAGVALGESPAASSLGSTEAFKGKDSEGQPAVFAVGLVLGGEPLATLPALPAYADCATACRLNATCSSFLYCGAQVRHRGLVYTAELSRRRTTSPLHRSARAASH